MHIVKPVCDSSSFADLYMKGAKVRDPPSWSHAHTHNSSYIAYTMSPKTTLMLHTITSTHINRFWYFWPIFCWESMLSNGDLSSHLVTNVSVLPGETWTHEIVSFQSCWVFAETTHIVRSNEILHGGWSSGDSSEIRILSKSVKQFRGCGESKLALSHWSGRFPTDHWFSHISVDGKFRQNNIIIITLYFILGYRGGVFVIG